MEQSSSSIDLSGSETVQSGTSETVSYHAYDTNPDDSISSAETQSSLDAWNNRQKTLKDYARRVGVVDEIDLNLRVNVVVERMIRAHIVIQQLAYLIAEALGAIDPATRPGAISPDIPDEYSASVKRLRFNLVGREEVSLRGQQPKPVQLYAIVRDCASRQCEITDDFHALQSHMATSSRALKFRSLFAEDWANLPGDVLDNIPFSFRRCEAKRIDAQNPLECIQKGFITEDTLDVCTVFWQEGKGRLELISAARSKHLRHEGGSLFPRYDINIIRRLKPQQKANLRARCMATFVAVEHNIVRQSEECRASTHWERIKIMETVPKAGVVTDILKSTRELREGISDIGNALRHSRVQIEGMFGGKEADLDTVDVVPLDVFTAVKWGNLRTHSWWMSGWHAVEFGALKEEIRWFGPDRVSFRATNAPDMGEIWEEKDWKLDGFEEEGMCRVQERIETEEAELEELESCFAAKELAKDHSLLEKLTKRRKQEKTDQFASRLAQKLAEVAISQQEAEHETDDDSTN